MPFPLEEIDAPLSVYVSDSQGKLSAIPFPIMKGLSLPEKTFLESQVASKTRNRAIELIKPIANKVSEFTKEAPEKFSTLLYKYTKNQFTDIDHIYGIAALHPIPELEEFTNIFEDSNLGRIAQAARVFLMMKRTEANKAAKWDPSAWTLEDALDPRQIPVELSSQIGILCQLEDIGKAHYCISARLNKAGVAVNVFYYSDSTYQAAKEKLEDAEEATPGDDQADEEMGKK